MAVAPAKAVAPTEAGESGTDVEPSLGANRRASLGANTDGRVNIRKSISAGMWKNLRKSSCEDSAEQKQRSPATEAPQEGSDVKKSALKSKPLGLRHRDVQVNRCEPCACS